MGSPDQTVAAVLVPVFRDDHGDLRIVLIVRGSGGVHGGQVALPGGKREAGDATLRETALRETEEEIGLRESEVEIVAELSPIDSHTTGFRVYPFLARILPPEQWRLAAGEIVDVLTPTVRELAGQEAHRSRCRLFPDWQEPREVEGVLIGDHLLWGLTLRLLDRIVPGLLRGEWDF